MTSPTPPNTTDPTTQTDQPAGDTTTDPTSVQTDPEPDDRSFTTNSGITVTVNENGDTIGTDGRSGSVYGPVSGDVFDTAVAVATLFNL